MFVVHEVIYLFQPNSNNFVMLANIMKKSIAIILWFSLAIITFCIALWALLWVFASFSLASGYCLDKGGFDLFHDEFKCKQPFVALIMFLVSSTTTIVLLFKAIYCLMKPSKST